MRLKISQTAASVLYSAIMNFFLILPVLGLTESLLSNNELMYVTTPMTALISGICYLILHFLKSAKLNKKTQRALIPLILTLCLVFTFLQLAFWLHMDVEIPLGPIDKSPFALSLAPIFMFGIASAVLLKFTFSNVRTNELRSIKVISLLILTLGSAVWYQSSFSLIKTEEANAREKVKLIEIMLNKTLADQQKALNRIIARAENLNSTEFNKLIKTDSHHYTADYDMVKGILVLDDNLKLVYGNEFAENFYNTGKLEKPTIKSWLLEKSKVTNFAANSLTLKTETPVLMFHAITNLDEDKIKHIIMLVDMNLLFEKNYLGYLSKYDTFIELTPELFFSIDIENSTKEKLVSIKAKYNHFITETMVVNEFIKHRVYSFISNYQTIHFNTVITQLTLWLTFLFLFIVILIADASRESAVRAKFDEVTGLLRLNSLRDELRAFKGIEQFSVFILKIDLFESIISSLGHEVCDEILRVVACRIKATMRGNFVLSKGFGDSFVIYLFEKPSDKNSECLTQLLNEISRTYEVNNLKINLTASAGCVSYTTPADIDIKHNLHQANIALAQAIQRGGNQPVLFQAAMEDEYKEAVDIRNALFGAIKDNQFSVFYQPIHKLEDESVVGVEALIRWEHNDKWISPAKFIPIAETTEQIVQIGDLVLQRVISDINRSPALQRIKVAVNFSAKQIIKPDFLNNLIDQIANSAAQFNNFTVEVTESSLQDKSLVSQTLQAAMNKGINIAIDDFGTGYSSLSSLANQPSNIIKIDREFTFGAEIPSKEQRLLDTIINACIDLDKAVVVEGVEGRELISYLRKYKEIRIQGYFYSKPLPLEELIEYIHNHKVKKL
ncbi:putative bifunctional diguanylate cyclase/phosphodiesterase [Pseudoalteromonas sp.]|uniref:putative bifunctional diguanylate cyclase/phosphodiesterase n=1 Tax=Pseudoalteromonas sp. TaxID=53249 RepID=UPI0035112812